MAKLSCGKFRCNTFTYVETRRT